MFSAICSKAVNKTCWAILTFKAARLFLFQEAALWKKLWAQSLVKDPAWGRVMAMDRRQSHPHRRSLWSLSFNWVGWNSYVETETETNQRAIARGWTDGFLGRTWRVAGKKYASF